MLQKKENLEEIKELRRFYLSEYRKDKADFRKRSQKDKEKKKFPPTLSKANKIRFYFISKEEYFPCLIKQTKKELEKSEPTSFQKIKDYIYFSDYKKLKNKLEKKLEILSNNLEKYTKKYDGLFCDILDGRLG